MKYALFSDVHGNLPALDAVLEDARRQGVDRYLFLGDYIEDFPWPNEVADAIRQTDSSVAIRGNKEGYLGAMRRQDQSMWIYEQYAPLYWNYRELTPENLAFLVNLPEEATVDDEYGALRLAHSSRLFLGTPRLDSLHSDNYSIMMRESAFTHREYLDFSRAEALSHPGLKEELTRLPIGVYAFGHNHLQWHMRYGNALHVNPGSCGIPLDFDTAAPYTIVESTRNGWSVHERRVTYDVDSAISALRASTLYRQAPVWSEFVAEGLARAEEAISFFLRHAAETARNLGRDPSLPDNEVWRLAAGTWKGTHNA